MYIIGRPINGISMNGNEYAKAVLDNAGYTDDSIEAEGIIIEEELK